MKLSFIIPAHNEEAHLPRTLAALHAAARGVGGAYEVIVVDDDSTDRTMSVASRTGARVALVNLRQIGAVRNAGAREASGDVLVFLDADTLLPVETLRAALRALESGAGHEGMRDGETLGGAVGGGARVRFDGPIPLVGRAATAYWNCVSRTLRWAAGCFLFVRREAFEAAGGFDERFYAAEEIVLSQALHRFGPFTILPHPVITSARKIRPEVMNQQWGVALRMLLSGGRSLQRREGLDVWYDPRHRGERG